MPPKMTQREFEERSSKVHNNKYDYSNTVYTTQANKVTIICPLHGEFTQWPKDHQNGRGCRKCANITIQKAQTMTLEEFKIKGHKRHNNFYNYEKVVMGKNQKHRVTIICPIHGEFIQEISPHIQGAGCPECGKRKQVENRKNKCNGWTYTEWELAGQASKNFKGFSLYIIKCFSKEEEFIKIGKTFRSIEERFKTKRELPYEYIILHKIQGSARAISILENTLQAQYKNYRYTPQKTFHGTFECFTSNLHITQKDIDDTINNIKFNE